MMPVLGSNPGSALELAKIAAAQRRHGAGPHSAGDRRRRSHRRRVDGCVAEFPDLDPRRRYTGRRADSARFRRSARALSDRSARQHHRRQARRRTPRGARADVQRPLSHGRRRRLQSSASCSTRQLPSADDQRRLEGKFDLWADYGYWLALLLIPFALLNFRRGAVALLRVRPAAAAGARELVERPVENAGSTGLPGVAAGRTGARRQRCSRIRNGKASPTIAAATTKAPIKSSPPTRRLPAATTAATRWRMKESTTKPSPRTTKRCARNPTTKTPHSTRRCCEKLRDKKQVRRGRQQRIAAQSRPSAIGPVARAELRRQSEAGGIAIDAARSRRTSDPRRSSRSPIRKQSQPSDEDKQQTAEREAPRDEQRDALEQWLRRVPDDPSGLLRRKFQYETNERLRSGVPDPRDQERIW